MHSPCQKSSSMKCGYIQVGRGKNSVKNTRVRKKSSARKTKDLQMPSGLEEEKALRRECPVCNTGKRSEDMTARKSLSSGMPYGLKGRSPVTGMSRNAGIGAPGWLSRRGV